MFRFAEPTYLWLLLLIPILAMIRLYFRRKRKKDLRRFGDMRLLMQLSPYFSHYRPLVKFWLLQGVIALLVVMLARPQMGARISKEKREGIEAIIAMDISNSMLAEDVTPSRLEKGKLMVENLINHFRKDKVGLVVFAGDAFVQLPITSDYVSAKMFLDGISPSLIETQGTDIGQALDLSMHSFTSDDKTGKAIIVITDGEDHEGDAEAMAKAANDKGIKVFILGIGSTQGAPIPLGEGGYMTDSDGNTVMSALNENMCQKIAESGHGTYIHVDNSLLAEERLDREISKMQKGEIENVIYSDFDEQFQAIGILAVLLLIVEIAIMEAKNKVTQRWNLFARKK
ncbi:MAG: VWA domain-containing protein [Prevotella sp.]|nr:VWA domain-containing protein [Prevotella sp.]